MLSFPGLGQQLGVLRAQMLDGGLRARDLAVAERGQRGLPVVTLQIADPVARLVAHLEDGTRVGARRHPVGEEVPLVLGELALLRGEFVLGNGLVRDAFPCRPGVGLLALRRLRRFRRLRRLRRIRRFRRLGRDGCLHRRPFALGRTVAPAP
ncbi:hypothetical protein E1283_35250, partial [Streptomyces hainanensis]